MRTASCADFDLNLSKELNVGFPVRVLDKSVSLLGFVAEEENWRLIAIGTPLGPSHIVQE